MVPTSHPVLSFFFHTAARLWLRRLRRARRHHARRGARPGPVDGGVHHGGGHGDGAGEFFGGMEKAFFFGSREPNRSCTFFGRRSLTTFRPHTGRQRPHERRVNIFVVSPSLLCWSRLFCRREASHFFFPSNGPVHEPPLSTDASTPFFEKKTSFFRLPLINQTNQTRTNF